jgi:hypothetical protein
MSPDAEATFHCASCTPGNQVVAASDGPPFRQERRPTRLYRKNRARVGTPKVKATWQPNEIQIEVNTAPRTPEGWQGYFNKKVKEFGVYAVYNYSGVDRNGITSIAASGPGARRESDRHSPGVRKRQLPGRRIAWGLGGFGTAEHKATEAAQRQADLDERAAKLAKPDDP